jgi:hypothetical protein
MWLKTTLGGTSAANADAGYNIIKSVELQIGGTKIDKHYGRWMEIWSQLTKSTDHAASHTQMVSPTAAESCVSTTHSGNLSMSNTTLLTNYIYLDSEERKRFAQASHEYLIEQLQFTGVETVAAAAASEKVRLNFNHPVKELIWGVERAWATFSETGGSNSTSEALLQLNGHARFSKESGKFFNYVQPQTHHSRTPSAGINVYSFALNPEEHQPSGTCNFSRIDNATLTVTTTANSGTELYVYGINYNVLRVMSGMGGVAYSN